MSMAILTHYVRVIKQTGGEQTVVIWAHEMCHKFLGVDFAPAAFSSFKMSTLKAS